MGKEGSTKLRFQCASIPGFVSVIVPVYDDPSGLEDTLRSVGSQTLSEGEYEIIVANDGGKASISEVCQTFQVSHVDIVPRRGSYFARNRAIEMARGEYLAFVDADITVPQTWLDTGREQLQEYDYVGGPVVIDESKIESPADLYESINGFPTDLFFDEQYFCVTANLFVRRSVLERVGGFEERLESGGDNEFGRRVHFSGWFRQRYSREISVLHPPRGFKKLVRKKVRQHRGRILLNRLFPEHYNYPKPRIVKLVTSMLAPPRVSSVKRIHKKGKGKGFSLLDLYMFVWKYKYSVNLRLCLLYYLRPATKWGLPMSKDS